MLGRQGCLLLVSAALASLFLSGCASGRKQKLEQREKLANSSGLYCDFVNGEKNHEIELELNLVMAKRCDSDKPFTISNYKTPAEVNGMVYCCAIKREKVAELKVEKPMTSSPAPRVDPKPEPKMEKVEPSKTMMNTTAPNAPSKGQAPVDKKPSQPQDNKKTDLDEDIVPL